MNEAVKGVRVMKRDEMQSVEIIVFQVPALKFLWWQGSETLRERNLWNSVDGVCFG